MLIASTNNLLTNFQLLPTAAPFCIMSSLNKKGTRQVTFLGWKRDTTSENDNVASQSKRSRQEDEPIGKNGNNKSNNNNHIQKWENKSLPNGPMLLLRGTIGGIKLSQRLHTKNELSSLPDWNDHVTFQIFGKECRMRRRICQYSSGGTISYSYSGLQNVSAPDFPSVVYRIKCQVEDLLLEHFLLNNDSEHDDLIVPLEFMAELKAIKKSRDEEHDSINSNSNNKNRREIFNYCLLNHYRNGEEYMSYHTDDESTLHPQYPIASVSLGSTRNFDIRSRTKDANGKKGRLDRIPLGDGDLLLMFPPMQEYYEHGIPVEKRVVEDRINLTFRCVKK